MCFFIFSKRSRAFGKTLSEDAKCVFRIRRSMAVFHAMRLFPSGTFSVQHADVNGFKVVSRTVSLILFEKKKKG